MPPFRSSMRIPPQLILPYTTSRGGKPSRAHRSKYLSCHSTPVNYGQKAEISFNVDTHARSLLPLDRVIPRMPARH
eukprot:3470-Eustigmatos_ZCMA.PRE.1